ITHKFSIGGHEGYITAGMYEDGTVGEIFLTDIGKEGSTLRGMMNSFATAISISLQYGVPLETLVRKFSYMRFEPEGMTNNPEIPTMRKGLGLGPACQQCGGMMQRTGSCYTCSSCGFNTGCG